MNVLSRDQQAAIVAALTEGLSIRATERLTGIHRDTIMRLGTRVGAGCQRFHDSTMHSLRIGRIELDEIWSYVGKKQKRVRPQDVSVQGDQYVFIALAASTKAILTYRIGKRDSSTTEAFVYDLSERVLGNPEISTDGFHPYLPTIRAAFGKRASHGVINKTYSVSHLAVKDAARRYSPAEVIAVDRHVVAGNTAMQVSTSYVERQNLTLRMTQRRFGRLTNAFSKKLDNHAAAVDLYVSHYNFCRVHEALRQTPAMALGLTDHVWTVSELIEKALANVPDDLGRRRKPVSLRVIKGGKNDEVS